MFRKATTALLCVALLAAGATASAATKKLKRVAWLSGTTVTEYYPAPERWFDGARISVPGMPGRKARIDWLYSARGVSMQGDGVAEDGTRMHIASLGPQGWIDKAGRTAVFGSSNPARSPYWKRVGHWRNKRKAVTYKLAAGGWSNGKGVRRIGSRGVKFAGGSSRPLTYLRSVAVDPKLIPMGSLVWIGRYRSENGDGWFRADDTGSAIKGRHLDAYRRPPSNANGARKFSGQRVRVVPPNRIAAYVEKERERDTDNVPLPPSSLLPASAR